MADSTELRSFERLALAIGPSKALMVCAFFGSENIYIPRRIDEKHPLAQLIGHEHAGWLVAELGGQTIWVPALEMKPLRMAGRLRRLRRRGVSTSAAARELNTSDRHIRRITKKLLFLEGYSTELVAGDDTHS